MKHDIDEILKGWPTSETENVRKITDPNGVEKVQVRVDQGAFQGILQMNLDGRPDGCRPHNRDFALDHHKDHQAQHIAQTGDDDQFSLSADDCAELFEESFRVYQRYVFLLQIEDYTRVVRDTERNMEVFRFINRHAETEEDRMHLERWWPYIIRINATAVSLLHLNNNDLDRAIEVAAEAINRIHNMDPIDAEEFRDESTRSLEALTELVSDLEARNPIGMQEQLESTLAEAIEQEDYERAAKIRDQLNAYKGSSISPKDD
jgi:hypothetical protein